MKNFFKQIVKSFSQKACIVVLVGFLTLGGLTVCQTSCSTEKSTEVVKTSAKEPISVKQPVFLKIAVMPDRSGSIDSTRTPEITMTQLEKIIALVRENSGEIAFGFIDDDSNQPFIRLRIEPRPTPPPKPDEKNNPFDEEKVLADYKKKMREFKILDQKWLTETNQRILTFKADAQGLIDCLHDRECRSKVTDVLEGIKRADLFLNEKETVNSMMRVMLLISDGLETVKPEATPPALKSNPQIIVVNGSASLGVLKNYDVDAVEGIDRAIGRIAELLSAEQNKPVTVVSGNSAK